MNEQEFIKKLWNYGYFYAPKALEVDKVHEIDLEKLTLQDRVVKEAVRSYQDWFSDELSQLTMRAVEHGGYRRPANVDGDAGFNTIDLMGMPRCGCPDYPDPDHQAAIEQANWPNQCRNEITTSYRMSLSGIDQRGLAQIWQEADNYWNEALNLTFVFRPDDFPQTRVYAIEANLPGGVLADQYLANNNCGSRLRGRFDNRQWNARLLVVTIVHEHGHAIGLSHLRDSNATMYPSIHNAALARRGKPVESDIRAAERLGYSRRVDQPTPPTPPEPPNTPPSDDKKRIKVIITGESLKFETEVI